MNPFADIIRLPHYTSRTRRHMTISERAAQFSAFAALSGFDEDIDETARLTDPLTEMAEDDIAALNDAMQQLLNAESEHPAVTVTWFRPDAHKEGGAYYSHSGRFRHYDMADGVLIFTDKTRIPVQQICRIRIHANIPPPEQDACSDT